jgi:hypothetical protein
MSAAAIPLKSKTFIPAPKNTEGLMKHGPVIKNWFELIIRSESERKKNDPITQYFELRELPDGDMQRVEGKISASIRVGTESEQVLLAVRAVGLAPITVLNKQTHHYMLCAAIPRSKHLIISPLSVVESTQTDVDRGQRVVDRLLSGECSTLLSALYA